MKTKQPSKQLKQKRKKAQKHEPQQQGGFQQQQKVNPQEPSIDFDDDIPF